MMRLVTSRRYFGFAPSLDENELSEATDKPRDFNGFVQAHNLAIRKQCEMLGSRSTRKSPIPFSFCSSQPDD
ncbi:hypothetical protein [Rubritalea tangerina]|uniref:hypothetical protein n=1 Tax=Rubritalea tangerina TaxID=430798 RepID=UPI0036238E7B